MRNPVPFPVGTPAPRLRNIATGREAPAARGTGRGPAGRGGPLGTPGPAGPFQNWLAREIGVSNAYLSMLVNGGRAPSEGIRQRMLKALGLSQFHQLFKSEVTDEQP